ncbi:group-specific protein [Brevibacillus antibioticus]|uniref:Group-specific protein n=1 Tax=Brevibacillus antibioticus TaxID=2570228 RepID=A0A4V5TJS4_9BACL|nr:group-specific protein [Brevibacillus antibioticus]TKI59323.1 group-specific protein [Brevibacillus antibioticus]
MLRIEMNENEVREIIRDRIHELIKEFDAEKVFWDTTELKKHTCMCWNTIQDRFFFDPRFPKFKVGGKWYFPARETKEFLIKWLHEQ